MHKHFFSRGQFATQCRMPYGNQQMYNLSPMQKSTETKIIVLMIYSILIKLMFIVFVGIFCRVYHKRKNTDTTNI